jgi:uncharacterized protein
VHVSRIGFTPVKGGRHREHRYVDLALAGPVGDRVFCVVDPHRGRVLRTVENPALLRTAAAWRSGVLTVSFPDGCVEGTPVPTREVLKVDYWGRVAAVEIVDGPWAAAYSRHVGRDVVLARAATPGEVVYGASVSLVTTTAMAALARMHRAPVDEAAFRATFTVDAGGATGGVTRDETALDDAVHEPAAARRFRIGGAEIELRAAVRRCAVVDLDPATGVRASPLLGTLARYRRGADGVTFGVDAVVSKPGRVHVGDAVRGVERG